MVTTDLETPTDPCKEIKAGIDMRMPYGNRDKITTALKNDEILRGGNRGLC